MGLKIPDGLKEKFIEVFIYYIFQEAKKRTDNFFDNTIKEGMHVIINLYNNPELKKIYNNLNDFHSKINELIEKGYKKTVIDKTGHDPNIPLLFMTYDEKLKMYIYIDNDKKIFMPKFDKKLVFNKLKTLIENNDTKYISIKGTKINIESLVEYEMLEAIGNNNSKEYIIKKYGLDEQIFDAALAKALLFS